MGVKNRIERLSCGVVDVCASFCSCMYIFTLDLLDFNCFYAAIFGVDIISFTISG